MDWARDGQNWPNAAHSRFVDAAPHRWHVQVAGDGPVMLLLHGAGGATQSWRHLLPLLAERYRVVAPDLPGQGFTRMGTRMRCGIGPMAEDVTALCKAEGWVPEIIVGHSAGAALALEIVHRDLMQPRAVVGLNAALSKFDGMAGWLFPLMAKFMAINPLIPPLLARMAGGEARVAELLTSTGSEVDAEGVALYRSLMTDRAHIDGTLAMMSQWEIGRLLDRLPEIDLPVILIAGATDGTVSPEVSRKAHAQLRGSVLAVLEGLGHLAHEEAADVVARHILRALDTLPERTTALRASG